MQPVHTQPVRHNAVKTQNKEGLSTASKAAIAAGIASVLAIGADFVFCKGKHVKKLFNKSKMNNGGSAPAQNTPSANLKPNPKPNPKPSPSPDPKPNPNPNNTNTAANTADVTQSVITKPVQSVDSVRSKLINKYSLGADDFYQMRPACKTDIANLTSANTKDVYVSAENGWHFRFATKNNGNFPHCVDRISLNVYPEEGLIKALDDFIAQTRVNVEYKTPMSYKGWQTRHDPITMYFRESIPQDVKDEIIKIVSPYVRNAKDDVMLGKKLADGIYQVCEPTEQHVLNLIARAEKLGDDKLVQCLKSESPLFGAGLYQYSTSSGKNKVKTSPGLVKAVEQLLDDLEQITKC